MATGNITLSEHPAGGDFGGRRMTQLSEFEARLDALTLEILLPLRASKTVMSDSVSKLYELADELAAEMGDAEMVSRRLTGKLWFVFTQMLAEADHTSLRHSALKVR